MTIIFCFFHTKIMETFRGRRLARTGRCPLCSRRERGRKQRWERSIFLMAETIFLSNILCHEDNFLYTITKANISQTKIFFFLLLPKKIFPRPRLRARRARRWRTEESGQVGEGSQSCEINWICFSKIVEKGKECINKSCKTSWLWLQWTRWHVVYIRSQLWIRGEI